MRNVNIHEIYEHRLLYLLHDADTPQAKLLHCQAWLKELPQYPSLAAAIFPCFAACQDALQALVAARPTRGMVFRDSPRKAKLAIKADACTRLKSGARRVIEIAC